MKNAAPLSRRDPARREEGLCIDEPRTGRESTTNMDEGMQNAPDIMATTLTAWEPGIFTLAVFAVLTTGLVATILVLTVILNRRQPGFEKSRPYECGMIPTGPARFRYPTPFWLVAVFFLLFDVEAVYIVSWAVSFDHLGWSEWGRITFFIGVLLLGLAWIWRKGGLEWGVTPKY